MIKVVRNKKISIPTLRKENQLINYIFLFGVSLLLVIAPFYRGLYFRENYMPAIIAISSIFILFMIYNSLLKNRQIEFSYLELFMLLLPLAYIISFFVSVNMKNAYDSIL